MFALSLIPLCDTGRSAAKILYDFMTPIVTLSYRNEWKEARDRQFPVHELSAVNGHSLRFKYRATSTSRSHSPCPSACLRRLFSPRCNVLSAKPWLLQNSTCRSPLASNSVTRRLISWLLRRFRTLTSSLSVMPRVHQNRAGVNRWVRLTDTDLLTASSFPSGDFFVSSHPNSPAKKLCDA